MADGRKRVRLARNPEFGWSCVCIAGLSALKIVE
ncbi:unnamed protein product [Ectocarpus sp. CCAP 1310/34]|nr:unnamed protein product [Ectocarpus sp. CCAP 1310/34]